MDYSKRKNQTKRLLRWNHQEKLYARVWLYALRVICVAALIGIFALAGIALGTFMGMLDGVPELSREEHLPLKARIERLFSIGADSFN